MTVQKLKIKNVSYSFNDIRLYFKDNYPNTVKLYLFNGWYKVFNEDAKIISDKLNYKIFDDKYSSSSGNICCGFPKSGINKVIHSLKCSFINFCIINTSDYSYEYFDYGELNRYIKNYNNIIDNNNNIEDNINEQFIEIGDTVSILNLKNDILETYHILPTYHIQNPIGFSTKRGNGFGSIIYKDELLSESKIEDGIILSESAIAQKLLGCYLNSTIVLFDENLNECMYKVIDIKKH